MTTLAAALTPAETLQRIRAAQAIAVVRARDGEEALRIAVALSEAGLRSIEFTFTTPGVAAALAEARARLAPDVLLGAGTITDATHVEAAAAAGADFLVSPHLDPPLLEAMLAAGLFCLPGVLTPSEVACALRLGASAVKLFPASTVGIGHLRALFGPFPGLQVVPTGGVTVASAPDWLAAGAAAVGLGGELLPKRLLDAGAWDEITDNAARLLAELRRRA
jgi:2-dehydro-3-deoxyphosphogluconate aldolase / (4S)-4-hydroxy-2-oxoglutarate aldolase